MVGKKISIGNLKGGVGKSLISYLLYKHFENEYELMQSDLDVINNKVIHIMNKEDFVNKSNEIKNILSKKNLIIDTGGFLDDLQNYFFIKSDLIIIPIILNILDIKRSFLFIKFLINELKINPDKILIIINKYNKDKEKEKEELIEYLKKNYNIHNFFVLNNYRSYEKVINEDINLFEKFYYKRPAEQIKDLNNKIKKIIGE